MDGPWYETAYVVDNKYIYNDLKLFVKNSAEWKQVMKISQRLPYLIHDVGFLHMCINKCINKCIESTVGDKKNFCYGSLRGYVAGFRHILIRRIKKYICDYTKVKALMVLSNSNIVQNWMNHVLYSPFGPRYMHLKKEFESLVH